MISHEDGGLQALQQRFFPDVGIRIVDKHAGIDVAVGVDMQIAPPSGDTSAHIFAVILEIHRENRLLSADITDLMIHEFPLFRGRQQLRDRVVADGHVVEIPYKLCAPFHHLVDEVKGTDGI